MPDSLLPVAGRVGPFVVGAGENDLIALTQQPGLGLSIIEKHQQAQDYYRQRCDGLLAKAREFLHDYESSI
jgi:hypothetical protein